jgi:sphingomyelin phosphodiesterase
MVAAIKAYTPAPAFTIFTGDVAAHDIWLVDQAEVEEDLSTTHTQMLDLGLVYPAVGNHDTAPINAFPPAQLGTSNNPQWTYDTLASEWTTWIGSAAATTADQTGSYSTKYPGGNLRIISFNSIFYYTNNFWMYLEPVARDPSGQFAWLITELQAAETAGERVWMIAHIPSGIRDFIRDFSSYFDQIVQRYEATIAALFYGHTHLDHFHIAYTDYTNPSFSNAVAMSYITPSLTPTSGSPSFRVYSVDPVTFGILDFTEYITDINTPGDPVWTEYYSAKATYGALLTPPLTDPTAELTPAFWHNVTQVFETDDPAFQDYHARKSRGFDVVACTGSCKTTEICGLRAANSQYNCATVTPGLHFSKRDGGFVGQREECEGGQIRSLFAGMVQDRVGFVKMVMERAAGRK